VKRVVLAAVLALAGFAWGQNAPTGGNPLAGHEVEAILPETVFVFTDAEAGVTYPEPIIIEIDGRPALKITLKPVSAPMPRRKWGAGDWLGAGALAAAAAAIAYLAGQAMAK
jgi:hypothetical protein